MAIGSLVYYITEAGYPCNSPNNAKNCPILHFNARNSNAEDNYPYYRTGFFGKLFHNQVLDRFAFHQGSEAEGEEDLVLIRVLSDDLCDRNECIDVRISVTTYYLAANTSVNDEFYLTDDTTFIQRACSGGGPGTSANNSPPSLKRVKQQQQQQQ
eukprot:CAMPEP_0171582000 /NCGR_PEP_ID=MMETSP0961-20121227/9924_1 /TAXON_ID=87120 /ORGANISM="Aurantiochytrium limacinum, Strain ATCCMYA-1381" /LENGTH=154 /DNA_ID=CAMNT_0012138887 /DNA_START=351 /DNA_END=815 /DNA_ORIENTATION=+